MKGLKERKLSLRAVILPCGSVRAFLGQREIRVVETEWENHMPEAFPLRWISQQNAGSCIQLSQCPNTAGSAVTPEPFPNALNTVFPVKTTYGRLCNHAVVRELRKTAPGKAAFPLSWLLWSILSTNWDELAQTKIQHCHNLRSTLSFIWMERTLTDLGNNHP